MLLQWKCILEQAMCGPGVCIEPLGGSLSFVPGRAVLLLPQRQRHQADRNCESTGFPKTSSRHGYRR